MSNERTIVELGVVGIEEGSIVPRIVIRIEFFSDLGFLSEKQPRPYRSKCEIRELLAIAQGCLQRWGQPQRPRR